MDRAFIAIGAVMGMVAVAAGAFGAHGLRSRLTPADLAVFETAARYQMYHALALVLVGAVSTRLVSPLLGWSGWLFLSGVVVFSGSLYLLCLSGARWWGAVTPVGGLLLLGGWACLLVAAFVQNPG